MYEHTQIYKMYIKILRHGKKKNRKEVCSIMCINILQNICAPESSLRGHKKNIKLVNSNLRHVFI
jgi:hypothetical protein